MHEIVSFLQWAWGQVGGFNGVAGFVGGLGGVCGFIALFQTRRANKLAKDANRIAEEANRVSAESRDVAVTANELARKANEIGEDANRIARRALAAGSDQSVYNWTAQYDSSDSVLAVVNDCGLEARDVHVRVRCEGEVVAEGEAPVLSALGELRLDAPLLGEKLRKEAAALRYSGIIGTPSVKVLIGIVWTSEFGVHRSLESKQGFGYSKRKKTLV